MGSISISSNAGQVSTSAITDDINVEVDVEIDETSSDALTVSVDVVDDGDDDTTTIALSITLPSVDASDVEWEEVLSNLEVALSEIDGLSDDAIATILDNITTSDTTTETVAETEGDSTINEEVSYGSVGPATQKLYEILTSGNYPDATDFLSLILDAAQEIRAAQAEVAAAMGTAQYDTIMAQADKQFDAADANYKAAKNTVNAQLYNASAQIITGAITIVGAGAAYYLGGVTGLQTFAGLNQAQSGIINGSFAIKEAYEKMDAASFTKLAEELQAQITEDKATQTLIESAKSQASEMKAKMGELVTAVLNLVGSYNSQIKEVIQSANSV